MYLRFLDIITREDQGSPGVYAPRLGSRSSGGDVLTGRQLMCFLTPTAMERAKAEAEAEAKQIP